MVPNLLHCGRQGPTRDALPDALTGGNGWGRAKTNDKTSGPVVETHPEPQVLKLKVIESNQEASRAEGVGFEPTNGASPSPVFKTGAFNRSAIPPLSELVRLV